MFENVSLDSKITYCGNVHPVRQFEDLTTYLSQVTPKIQQAHGKAFPLGLWLPNSALQEARSETGLKSLRTALDQLETQPITFNAFPMEVFHGERVKEKVYQPDWSETSRLNYTKGVAQLGVELNMPDFSISSLSGGFRLHDGEEKISLYLSQWLEWVSWARELEVETQSRVSLALEPEPFNTMEDEGDAILLWQRLLELAQKTGVSEEDCQRYLGLCFDTCHFSVRYIPLVEAWEKLKQAGLPVHKIQVSVAPCWKRDMGEAALNQFFKWNEPVYLHQSFAWQDGQRHDFLDLEMAQKSGLDAEQWRTHFHVPIHYGHRQDSTGSELIEFLKHLKNNEAEVPTLEVETYSFHSMGDQWGEKEPLEYSIAKEMAWLKEQML
jgi:hypothetical protein